MKKFLEQRVRLIHELLESSKFAQYSDIALLCCTVLNACASARWPGERIDKKRFVELLVNHSLPEARTNWVSVPSLVFSKLVNESKTKWGDPGQTVRIFIGDEIDLSFENAVSAFPFLKQSQLRTHCYAALIYTRLRCGYAHCYYPAAGISEHPPSYCDARISYIGRSTREGITRISTFHLDYLVSLVEHHVSIVPDQPSPLPKEWWLDND